MARTSHRLLAAATLALARLPPPAASWVYVTGGQVPGAGGWGGQLPVLSLRGGGGLLQLGAGLQQDRQRLGIEFPLAQAAPAGTVKQLPSPDTGDSADTLEITENLETVDIADTLDTEDTLDTTESADTLDSVDTNTTEVREPCCDNAVSNTVQLATAGDSAEYEEEIISGSVRCVKKIVMAERLEFEEEVECEHGVEQLCYTSLVTTYSPHQQQECGEDYIKDCFIDYDKAASSSTVRVCSRPLVKDCGGGGGGAGEVECSTHQQTECVTREEEHQVQEDRAECRTVTERRCGDTQLAKLGIQFPLDQQQGTVKQLGTDTEDADTEDTAASSSAQETRCTEWPRQECEVRPVNVTRTSPVTECRAVPVELCGPARCPVKEAATEECEDRSVTVVRDQPGEQCSIQPKQVCKTVTKLVPSLTEVEQCDDIPQEVCSKKRGKPRTVKYPSVKKWCYKTTSETTTTPPTDQPRPGYGRSLF